MKKTQIKALVGSTLVLAIAFVLFSSISSGSMTYYEVPSKILETPQDYTKEDIRVMGLVVKDSVTWDPKKIQLQFQITDDNQSFINVSYTGSKPDMFREGQGIVVEGKLDPASQQFHATTLLVKHTEDYKTEEHQGSKEAYYNSLSQNL